MRMLSVVTLVRNRNQMLDAFLRGWARQDVDELEVVVVHAGGHEDPTAVSSRYRDLRVSHVALPTTLDNESIAYSHARNVGAGVARGDRLVFCDADTIPTSGFATSLHAALDNVDALLSGDIHYLPPDADVTEPIAALQSSARPHPHRPEPPVEPGRVDLSLRHAMVWGLSMGMRASTFAEVGGFDESFSGYAGEDTDLATAIEHAGRPAGLVGGAVVLHQHHDSFEPPLHQMRATVANAQRYRNKWGVWPMEGWLEQFESLGLIAWTDESIDVLRDPLAGEVEQYRCTEAAPFRTAS